MLCMAGDTYREADKTCECQSDAAVVVLFHSFLQFGVMQLRKTVQPHTSSYCRTADSYFHTVAHRPFLC